MAKRTTAPSGAKNTEKEAIHMAKTEKEFTQLIVRDAEGNRYTLEFNRRSIERMERAGFKLDPEYPSTMISQLFNGAFYVHHKGITMDRTREIWDAQTNREKLLEALTKMYMKPINDLMGDPEGTAEDNPTWETV